MPMCAAHETRVVYVSPHAIQRTYLLHDDLVGQHSPLFLRLEQRQQLLVVLRTLRMLQGLLIAICSELFLPLLSHCQPITRCRVRHQNLEIHAQFLLNLFPVFTLLHHLDCLHLHLSRIAGPPVSAEGVGPFSRFT